MDIASGISMVVGAGTLLGTAAEHKKLSPLGKCAGYGTGAALVLFSVWEHLEHKKKQKRWHDMMRHRRGGGRKKRCPPADYKIVGGRDPGDYNFEFAQRGMVMAQEAGHHAWPKREPIGYMTGIGLEERGIPASGLYSYPDNIYQHARARLTPQGWA